MNNFLTAYIELNKIPGESISDSHVLSFFISCITDPYFHMAVQIKRNDYVSLINDFIAVRKQEI